MKVLFASTPAIGHVTPLMAIARILVEAGHDVSFLCASAFRERIRNAGMHFLPLPPQLDFSWEDFTGQFPTYARLEGPAVPLFEFQHFFVGSMGIQFDRLRELTRAFKPELCVYDCLFCGALPISLEPRASRPKMVACAITYLLSERADRMPFGPYLSPPRDDAERAQRDQLRFEADRVLIRPIQDLFDRALGRLAAPPLPMPWMDALVMLPDLYLQPSVPGFEYPRMRWPDGLRFVGSLPAYQEGGVVPEWWADVDGSRRTVLVTQGTVANRDFSQLVAPTLKALQHESDILVLVTTGGRSPAVIPCEIPTNARVAQFLPINMVLPRIDALITNGGYGGVNQALALGIPLIAAGRSEDKAEVSARIAWSGVGIDLGTDRPTPNAIRAAVRAVLDGPGYRARAEAMAAEFARYDTRAELLRLLTSC